MSLETQIRRTLVSFAMVLTLAGFAATRGDAAVDDALAGAALAECPGPAAGVEPEVAAEPAAPVSAQTNWRARLPASIARSRS